jgi:predicted Rossmann-fold nucleotide-binding protein
MSERIVTIFGTGRAKPGDAAYALAEEIGRLLAEAGFTIANGGYGGTMYERLETLIELGQAYVVLAGGTGTLLELAKVWELKNKGFLAKDKPIILVGGYWKALVDLIAIDDPDSSGYIHQVDEPERVVELVSGD